MRFRENSTSSVVSSSREIHRKSRYFALSVCMRIYTVRHSPSPLFTLVQMDFSAVIVLLLQASRTFQNSQSFPSLIIPYCSLASSEQSSLYTITCLKLVMVLFISTFQSKPTMVPTAMNIIIYNTGQYSSLQQLSRIEKTKGRC